MRMRTHVVALAVAAGVMGCAAGNRNDGTFTATDRDAVVRVSDACVEGWAANDAAKVTATLTPDAIIVPNGLSPIAGADAIREFWWPADGPATRITGMDQTVDQVEGSGDLAVVRGRGTLSFEMALNDSLVSRTNRLTFMNVLRRQADGSWRITQRTWSDLR